MLKCLIVKISFILFIHTGVKTNLVFHTDHFFISINKSRCSYFVLIPYMVIRIVCMY